MTTTDDILAQRDAATAILTAKMVAANDFMNKGAAGMDDVINALAAQRSLLAAQAYEAALDDPALAAALAKLKAVTKEMNEVAKKMVSAAAIIGNVNGLVAASSKVVPVLKGLGEPACSPITTAASARAGTRSTAPASSLHSAVPGRHRLVMTISRYSLGATIVSSPERLCCCASSSMSLARAACAGASSAAKPCIGP